MTRRHAVTLAAFAALAFGATSARADADPALGYVFTSYQVPYHLTTGISKSGFFDGSEWTTRSPQFAKRTDVPSPWGLDAVGFGAGIGYDGFNAQVDVLSASSVAAGALTFGYRLNIQFGNIELWTRLAAGPNIRINYSDFAGTESTGGIVSMLEAGVDYFFWKETMAVGVKGTAAPHYNWKLDFGADFDLKLGLRLII